MSNLPDQPARKVNKFAIASLVTGLFSILIYPFVLVLAFYVHNLDVALLALSAAICGVALCLTSLIASYQALQQIKKGERNYGIAITGRILGILGVITGLSFCYLMYYALLSQ